MKPPFNNTLLLIATLRYGMIFPTYSALPLALHHSIFRKYNPHILRLRKVASPYAAPPSCGNTSSTLPHSIRFSFSNSAATSPPFLITLASHLTRPHTQIAQNYHTFTQKMNMVYKCIFRTTPSHPDKSIL